MPKIKDPFPNGLHAFRLQATILWLWLKIKQEGLRGFWSMFPRTKVPFWDRFFEPQPYICAHPQVDAATTWRVWFSCQCGEPSKIPVCSELRFMNPWLMNQGCPLVGGHRFITPAPTFVQRESITGHMLCLSQGANDLRRFGS